MQYRLIQQQQNKKRNTCAVYIEIIYKQTTNKNGVGVFAFFVTNN